MTTLSDELLKQIAEGSGRCYPHEGKAMALELVERRKRDAVLSLAPPMSPPPQMPRNWQGGTP